MVSGSLQQRGDLVIGEQPALGEEGETRGVELVAGAVRGTEVLETVEHPTDVSSGDAVLEGIETAVREVAESEERPTGVGIGVPSQINFVASSLAGSLASIHR